LNDEELYPELFVYFVQHAPAQVLDNEHGNVNFGIAMEHRA
jgi:hypothetical protein